MERIVTRARTSGQLRSDVEVNDFFPIVGMIGEAAEFSGAIDASNWKRYFTIVIDGLRAGACNESKLRERALTGDVIDTAKAALRRRRR
ncbi:hypothetical protein E5720_18870 [Rhodococcus sp. PAMC28707]|uniref:SbtR family transcriptional regulator n=1 Tax=unclassified Rhodococcus (in: high G+C Gram-positive bacteria) TaxID=192944 RepID=UPI00109D9F8E|nr:MULTISPECIES: hypothetical protein [unclassified Rhodococcus (in: high G+C Gram-positive bacteria)]QCB51604.1 hypothetical protein E5769_16655 [Rhodococcus sp. PAMC28705]QCB60228.1 hypothetical protein E5720_18870 [Rhodococcus sp. PAMC28707]